MNYQIIKKEFKESLFESKGLWMIAVSAAILSGLCFLVLSMKEGSVLAQNDILQYAIKSALFLTLIVSMVLGSASFIVEREENTMESLLLTPIPKRDLAVAKYLGVMVIGIVMLAAAVPYLMAIGAGSGLIVSAIGILFFGGLLLLTAFVALSIILSILMNSSKASVLTSILIMTILTFPAMIQGLFKLSSIGTFILKIDPIACCFNMMAAILTDKVSFFALGSYIMPLVLFAFTAVILMILLSGRIALKGEK